MGDMRGKYDFREPLLIEDNGLYITAAQMQFYLNRPNGTKEFENADENFMKYYKNCCLYNVVYDMMEEDPDCARMYWDTTNNSVAVSFSLNGNVAKTLAKLAEEEEEEEDEFDDPEHPFGIFE